MKRVLDCKDRTKAEEELYNYTGCYEYERAEDSITYIATDKNGLGYGKNRDIFPWTISLWLPEKLSRDLLGEEPEIDENLWDHKLIFHIETGEIEIQNLTLDLEALRIITDRAEELGMRTPEIKKDILRQKLFHKRRGESVEFTPEETETILQWCADLREY